MITKPQLALPDKISISWFEVESSAWLELEVTGEYLNWLLFRALPDKPCYYIENLHSINNAPDALLKIYGIDVSISDIKKAYQNYRQSGGTEGKAKLRG